jgi:hypothetical protein
MTAGFFIQLTPFLKQEPHNNKRKAKGPTKFSAPHFFRQGHQY